MFVVMNRFFVEPDYTDQFETRIKNRPQRVDGQAGFVRAQFLRPTNPDDPYIVLTVWETQAHYEAWVNDPAFTAKHAGKRTLSKAQVFRRENQVETFEVVLDSGE